MNSSMILWYYHERALFSMEDYHPQSWKMGYIGYLDELLFALTAQI